MIKVTRNTGGSLDEIQAGLSQIAAIIDQLEEQLRRLEESWNGEARAAFSQASRQAQHQIRMLNSIVESGRGTAQGHVDNVGAFDSRRASAWKR